MIKHVDINSSSVFKKIKNKEIFFAGNKNLMIYGMLHCASGKRIKKENRIFFTSKEEAVGNGYRPCGHCMKGKYKDWKRSGLD